MGRMLSLQGDIHLLPALLKDGVCLFVISEACSPWCLTLLEHVAVECSESQNGRLAAVVRILPSLGLRSPRWHLHPSWPLPLTLKLQMFPWELDCVTFFS